MEIMPNVPILLNSLISPFPGMLKGRENIPCPLGTGLLSYLADNFFIIIIIFFFFWTEYCKGEIIMLQDETLRCSLKASREMQIYLFIHIYFLPTRKQPL